MGTVPKRFAWGAARVCRRLRYPSSLANSLNELEEYVQHQCVVESVHFTLPMTSLHLWLCVAQTLWLFIPG